MSPTSPDDKHQTSARLHVARPIRPARPRLNVRLRLPGSKSITNRALLLAALADGRSPIGGALKAGDTLAFAAGLRSLGFLVDETSHGWRVSGAGGRIPSPAASVDCAEAGTAARFLLAACAAGAGTYRFDGGAQLRRRPLGLLLDALRQLGVTTEPAEADRLPLAIATRGLAGGDLHLRGETSSQFVSALLMAAPLARAPLTLTVDDLVSRPYVDMTLAMMKRFGVNSERDGYRQFRVLPATYVAGPYVVEPDASTASYFAAAAAVTGGTVTLLDLYRATSLQGDTAFVDVLAAMGCRVDDGDAGITVAGPAELTGVTVDMGDISDTFMTLAAIAPLATTATTITGIANVRLKESDRIDAVASNLRRLGVACETGDDYLRVFPAQPTPAVIDPHDDHRIAMSFSVLGLRVPGIVIGQPSCVNKTCPDFFELWAELEGD